MLVMMWMGQAGTKAWMGQAPSSMLWVPAETGDEGGWDIRGGSGRGKDGVAVRGPTAWTH